MRKLLKYLTCCIAFPLLSACNVSTKSEPQWAQNLDLCQLASWRSDAYKELNAACISAPNADTVLVDSLAKRSQCLASDDFTDCLAVEHISSNEASLDRARRLATSTGKPLENLLWQALEDQGKVGWRENDRLDGWKKELDKNGILKGKYAKAIRGTRWNASEIDWLAYHAFAAENSSIEEHQLISNVTLATYLADFGSFKEAKAVLSKVNNSDLERVLRPDWTLYGAEKIDFSAERRPYEQRAALSGYRKTVAAIFAINLHSNGDVAARMSLEQSRETLTLMGKNGAQHINLMEFLLGKSVESEELFDKLYLGPRGDGVDFDNRGMDGLNGWESLANNSALAPVLASRLEELNLNFPEHSFETKLIWNHDPNMADVDFLKQPSALRTKMAHYKTILKDRIREHDWESDSEPTKVEPPKHVTFEAQVNTPQPVSDDLIKIIREAGIGSYGVVAARELPLQGVQIIYKSNAIDPSGETGVGGYWLLEGYPQKEEWEEPLYLGLRTLLPFTIDGYAPDVIEGSLKDLDSLVLVGARQPLNLGSLTFPPIAMETGEPERGLITIDLKTVKRDRDGDILTDLFELRVGLNPENPDTDQDGLRDNRDSVPTRAYEGTSKDRSRAYALLSILEGHEDGAIIQAPATADQIQSDPFFGLKFSKEEDPEQLQYTDPIPSVLYLQSDFEGLGNAVLPYMLIVQTESEADAISETFPPHYPIQISRQIEDPYSDRMIVIWSAGWVGGTVLLTRQPTGGYKREVLSSWIT